jgi:hypothetical protein
MQARTDRKVSTIPSAYQSWALTAIFAAAALLVTQAQRLADWRSKTVGRILGMTGGLVFVFWIYYVFLWLFHIDLIGLAMHRSTALWVTTGLLVAAGAYSISLVAMAHITKLRILSRRLLMSAGFKRQPSDRSIPEPSPASVPVQYPVRAVPEQDLVDDLEIISPDLIGVHIRSVHQEKTGIDGLVIGIINNRTETVTSCVVAVDGSHSFDVKRMTFREDLLGHARIARVLETHPDNESGAVWFMRVNDRTKQLEIGDTKGAGVLTWPNRDSTAVQRWRLVVRIEAEIRTTQNGIQKLAAWQFYVGLVWSRNPNKIRLIRPTT